MNQHSCTLEVFFCNYVSQCMHQSFNVTFECREHVVYVSATEQSRQAHLTVSSLYCFVVFILVTPLIPTNSREFHPCLEQAEVFFSGVHARVPTWD